MAWTLTKDRWAGNGWPAIDFHPYEYADFPKVLLHVATSFGVPLPGIVDLFDGYAADLLIDGARVTLHVDNWTMSLACEREDVRDRILTALASLVP